SQAEIDSTQLKRDSSQVDGTETVHWCFGPQKRQRSSRPLQASGISAFKTPFWNCSPQSESFPLPQNEAWRVSVIGGRSFGSGPPSTMASVGGALPAPNVCFEKFTLVSVSVSVSTPPLFLIENV